MSLKVSFVCRFCGQFGACTHTESGGVWHKDWHALGLSEQ